MSDSELARAVDRCEVRSITSEQVSQLPPSSIVVFDSTDSTTDLASHQENQLGEAINQGTTSPSSQRERNNPVMGDRVSSTQDDDHQQQEGAPSAMDVETLIEAAPPRRDFRHMLSSMENRLRSGSSSQHAVAARSGVPTPHQANPYANPAPVSNTINQVPVGEVPPCERKAVRRGWTTADRWVIPNFYRIADSIEGRDAYGNLLSLKTVLEID